MKLKHHQIHFQRACDLEKQQTHNMFNNGNYNIIGSSLVQGTDFFSSTLHRVSHNYFNCLFWLMEPLSCRCVCVSVCVSMSARDNSENCWNSFEQNKNKIHVMRRGRTARTTKEGDMKNSSDVRWFRQNSVKNCLPSVHDFRWLILYLATSISFRALN